MKTEKTREPFARLARAASLLSLSWAAHGCTGGACHVQYAGNYADDVAEGPRCNTVKPPSGAATGYTLQLTSTSATAGVSFTASFDLGESPAPGSFSPESIRGWQAVALSNSNCSYAAGSDVVPHGNFALTLTSVTAPSAGPVTAHGTLHVTQYVQAPAGVDCGPGDVETVDFQF